MESAVALKDRLPALKERVSRADSRFFSAAPPPPIEDEDDGGIHGILQTVDGINYSMREIADKIIKLKFSHAIILSSVQNQDARNDSEQLNSEIKKLSRTIHGQLKQMKDSLEKHESGHQLADYRIMETQYSALSRRFRSVMDEYNAALESFREKNKDCIVKQLDYAKESLSDAQVESMLESNDTHIFAKDILLDACTEDKRIALGEVEARHQDILQLEDDIKELHQMFCDLALLVDEQGEMIDRIETNIENAAVWIQEGAREVAKCVNIANQRPKICCCCW